MNFVTISDIHVRDHSDQRYQDLLHFLEHPKTVAAEGIFFLGDIFDLMVGSFNEYIAEYQDFFRQLKKYSKTKQILWIEGNHDFHCEGVFKKALGADYKNFHYSAGSILLENGIFLSHGDELDLENEKYIKYRKIIRSNFAHFFANNLVSYNFVCRTKDSFQKKSRENQRNHDDELEGMRFQKISEKLLKSYGPVFLGHSHKYSNANGYFNNGFFPETKTFFHCLNREVSAISL